MKIFALVSVLLIGNAIFAQDVEPMLPCPGLPLANPEVHAVCMTADGVAYLEAKLPEKLKTGTHAAVYKLTVDCHGSVTTVHYERGTFTVGTEGEVFLNQNMVGLTWKPAEHKSQTVTSIAFVTLEIVNGKVNIIVQ
jgi:hypothetical protein